MISLPGGWLVEVDYSLFIVARFREERARGAGKLDAIQTAGATAGQAVLFSRVTVIFALIGLMFIGHDIFISLGLEAILVVLATIVASLTLLPEIKDAFGLGRVQVGAITATRELAGGLVMLPSGIILDVLRPYWGIVLSLCMLGSGLG